eukprot:2104734-Rhodomonas_salina.1
MGSRVQSPGTMGRGSDVVGTWGLRTDFRVGIWNSLGSTVSNEGFEGLGSRIQGPESRVRVYDVGNREQGCRGF